MAERKLPEVCEIPFIICDNSVNRYGWRLLVEGIDHTGFDKNPVCCVQHNTWSVPVGRWKDLKVNNGQLLGTVEFDRNDPDAVKLYWKYKDGFMNACSLNIMPVSESYDPADYLPGQSDCTITKSELIEVSLVTVGGQKNAVKLTTPEGNTYKLGIINKNQNQMAEEKKEVATSNPEMESMKLELEASKKRNAKNLVLMHKTRGVVQDAEVEHLQKLAITDYETVELMLESRKPAETTATTTTTIEKEGKELENKVLEITSNKETTTKTANERDSWSYMDWFKKDPVALNLMAEKEPEKFKALELAFQNQAKNKSLVFETPDK